jgi:(p)ppGpp synthase/HD superfamily hydrolase
MIYTPKTKQALKLCFEAHKEQKDKNGMPYVFHPFHLAEQMENEETTIVALLHDVVEDTDYTIEDLAKMGFGEEVISALSLLTHDDGTEYMDYVRLIKDNPIAKAVKLADLKHNSDITRLDSVDEKALQRREKYLKAIAFLVE